jgi:hypothetical protein
MVCELQIIFGLHPIAGKLRVARHAFVLFVQLGRVAALALVAGIAAAAATAATRHARGLSAAATTTAAIVLAIIDQIRSSSSQTRHSGQRRGTLQPPVGSVHGAGSKRGEPLAVFRERSLP